MPKRKRSGSKFKSRKRGRTASVGVRRNSRITSLARRTGKRSFRKATKFFASAVFPETKTVTFTYFVSISLDPSANLAASQDFNCNDIFDPEVAVGGHQPRGHDEWATHYNNTKVLSSTCTATYYNGEIGNIGAIAVNKSGFVLETPNMNNIKEGIDYRGRDLQVGNLPTKISSNWNVKQYPQGTPSSSKQAFFGAQPATRPTYRVMLINAAPTTNPVLVTVHVKLTYTVMMFNRKRIAES